MKIYYKIIKKILIKLLHLFLIFAFRFYYEVGISYLGCNFLTKSPRCLGVKFFPPISWLERFAVCLCTYVCVYMYVCVCVYV